MDYRQARLDAGFPTQESWANYVGRRFETVSRYEGGRYAAPKWYGLLLQTLIENRRLKGEIE